MESVLFIGAVVTAVTELIKRVVPKVEGWVVIPVAGLVGLIVALVDTYIGVADVSIAQGIMIGLGASGVVTVASTIGRK